MTTSNIHDAAAERGQHTMSEKRPDFTSARAWLHHYDEALKNGETVWEPVTRDEIKTAQHHGVFLTRPHWRPSADACKLLGLPKRFAEKATPLPDFWKERLLETFRRDDTFRQQFIEIVKGNK